MGIFSLIHILLLLFVAILFLPKQWETLCVLALYIPFLYYDKKYIQHTYSLASGKPRKYKKATIITLMLTLATTGTYIMSKAEQEWSLFWGFFLVTTALWIPMLYDLADYLLDMRERHKDPTYIKRKNAQRRREQRERENKSRNG